MRAVERKDARRDFRITDAAADAGELLAIERHIAVVRQHPDQPTGEFQRGLHRIGQPSGQRLARFHHQPIDDDFDRVFLLFIERDVLAQVNQPTVDPGPDVAGPAHVEQFFAILAFPAADDRSQELKLAPLRQQADGIHHLLHGLRGDFLAALKAGGASDPGKEETEIVVNLRDGADRGTGVVAGALLLDGNGGREPFDRIDVGLAHLFEELTGIGRERLDVPPLSLGIDRVEGQRRLARPAQPRDHDEPVARDRHVDVLEIVLPRPFNDDRVMHQGRDYNIQSPILDTVESYV